MAPGPKKYVTVVARLFGLSVQGLGFRILAGGLSSGIWVLGWCLGFTYLFGIGFATNLLALELQLAETETRRNIIAAFGMLSASLMLVSCHFLYPRWH